MNFSDVDELLEEFLEESLEESLEEELEEELEESSEESSQESSSEVFEFDYDRLETMIEQTKDEFNQPLATIGLLSVLGFITLIFLGIVILKEV